MPFIYGVIALAVLGWILWKKFRADDMQRLNDERRASCRIVGKGELIESGRHIPVALALNESTLFYENADLAGSLELHWIHEVEYDNELLTGQLIERGKVMRLRCFSTVLEFVVDSASAGRWQANLPALQLTP